MSIDHSTDTLAPGIYIVATPIGNLGDITLRAAEVLSRVDLIAAEDTRVTVKLLNRIGTKRPMVAYHDHSGADVRDAIIRRAASESVALVSDAGTPLISDPGYKLIAAAREAGIMITALPGPCAAIAALTLSGLPTDRFLFAGFLPAKEKACADTIAELGSVDTTLVFYENGKRLGKALAALASLGDRPAVVAREITKKFEEVATGTLQSLAARYAKETPKGEIVIVVGPPVATAPDASTLDAYLRAALGSASVKAAVAEVTAKLGLPRKTVYARALELKDGD